MYMNNLKPNSLPAWFWT